MINLSSSVSPFSEERSTDVAKVAQGTSYGDDLSLSDLVDDFRDECQDIRAAGWSLDAVIDVIPYVCAACKRISQRDDAEIHAPHLYQIAGAVSLVGGRFIQMDNGEGKTQAAAMAAVLRRYLTGDTVHLSTRNDYLVRRDATWMWPLYDAFDLEVTTIEQAYSRREGGHRVTGQSITDVERISRSDTYAADVVYAHHKTVGYDFLYDRLAPSPNSQIQTGLDFVIVDEVDSTLIDDARSELSQTQSGASRDREADYRTAYELSGRLEEGTHFEQKNNRIELTDEGQDYCERELERDLYEDPGLLWADVIVKALRVREIYERGDDYIVDQTERTVYPATNGRPSPNTRYSGGLHQLLLIHENLPYQPEGHTLARRRVSVQRFYKEYDTLAGMSGSAAFVEDELESIYDTPVNRFPPHRGVQRDERDTLVLLTKVEAWRAACTNAIEEAERGRPVLISVPTTDGALYIEQRLRGKGRDPLRLNALDEERRTAPEHAEEAQKVEHLGKPGVILVSANMAGRGTDVTLTPEAESNGGLHVIICGVRRLRVTKQLRGRSGRQGKPGSSICIASLEDDIMKRFGSERVQKFMDTIGMEEGEVITHPFIDRSIQRARRKLRDHDARLRSQLYEADTVLDQYRSRIYELRRRLIYEESDLDGLVERFSAGVVQRKLRHERETTGDRPSEHPFVSRSSSDPASENDSATESVGDGSSDDALFHSKRQVARDLSRTLVDELPGLTAEALRIPDTGTDWTHLAGELAGRLTSFFETQTASVRDVVDIGRVNVVDLSRVVTIRDALDTEWVYFLDRTDDLLPSAQLSRTPTFQLPSWIREQASARFSDVQSRIEWRVLRTWAQKLRDPHQIVDDAAQFLVADERFDEAVDLTTQWAEVRRGQRDEEPASVVDDLLAQAEDLLPNPDTSAEARTDAAREIFRHALQVAVCAQLPVHSCSAAGGLMATHLGRDHDGTDDILEYVQTQWDGNSEEVTVAIRALHSYFRFPTTASTVQAPSLGPLSASLDSSDSGAKIVLSSIVQDVVVRYVHAKQSHHSWPHITRKIALQLPILRPSTDAKKLHRLLRSIQQHTASDFFRTGSFPRHVRWAIARVVEGLHPDYLASPPPVLLSDPNSPRSPTTILQIDQQSRRRGTRETELVDPSGQPIFQGENALPQSDANLSSLLSSVFGVSFPDADVTSSTDPVDLTSQIVSKLTKEYSTRCRNRRERVRTLFEDDGRDPQGSGAMRFLFTIPSSSGRATISITLLAKNLDRSDGRIVDGQVHRIARMRAAREAWEYGLSGNDASPQTTGRLVNQFFLYRALEIAFGTRISPE